MKVGLRRRVTVLKGLAKLEGCAAGVDERHKH